MVALGGAFTSHIDTEIPKKWPDVWIVPEQAIIPEEAPIRLPPEVEHVTPAPELTAVMSESLYRATESEARSAVKGFTVSNDVSVKGEWPGYGNENLDQILGTGYKIFETFSPVLSEYGPMAIGDIDDLYMEATVDGEVVVEGSTDLLGFSIPEILAHVSKIVRLEENDLVALGDPGNPSGYLDTASSVTCTIESVGELTNPVERLS